jgi:circadian clock protein KaiC
LAGTSGTGKSILASHFIHEGLRRGEPGVVAIFEEIPEEYIARCAELGLDMRPFLDDGTLNLLYLRPLDLSVDETVHEVVNAVKAIGAKRVVIDSLVGFEMALAPGFRDEFRESLYRMIGAIIRLGVTVVSTVEIEEDFTSMGLSHFGISFLADDLIRLRYVSIQGQLRKMMVVIKMRSGAHSFDIHEYEITGKGIVIGKSFKGLRALTSGIPGPWGETLPGLP